MIQSKIEILLFLKSFFQWLGVVSFLLLLFWLLIRILYGRAWKEKIVFRSIVGRDLKRSIRNFAHEWPEVQKDTVSDLAGSLINRFTRPFLVGLMVSLIPIILLYIQNSKIQQQNDLIIIQNDHIKTQTILLKNQNDNILIQNNLLDSERISSLVFLMSNILDKLDDEIKDQSNLSNEKGPDNEFKYKISNGLIGRIVALSRALKPYKVLKNDSLGAIRLSPERAQLFISLINSPIDSTSLKKIWGNGDFSFADIGKIDIEDINLSKIKLTGSNLSESNLKNVNFSGADLSNATMFRSTFHNIDFRKSVLVGTNFVASAFLTVDFSEAIIHSSTNIKHTNILKSYFNNTDLTGVSFEDTKMISVSFQNSSLWDTKFSDSELKHLYFFNSDLLGANFNNSYLEFVSYKNANIMHVTFNNSEIKDIELDGALIDDLNSLKILVENSKMTDKSITKTYYIDSTEYKTGKFRNATIGKHYKIKAKISRSENQ